MQSFDTAESRSGMVEDKDCFGPKTLVAKGVISKKR